MKEGDVRQAAEKVWGAAALAVRLTLNGVRVGD